LADKFQNCPKCFEHPGNFLSEFVFEHQDFPRVPKVLGRSEIYFNLHNLPEIIRLHKIPIMAKTNSSIQEKNSQIVFAKCPIVFGKMGKKVNCKFL
jgi:hypothetical protein